MSHDPKSATQIAETVANAPQRPPAHAALMVKLSIMMFLQYAIWGAWTTGLGAYLNKTLHFSGQEIGWIFACLWLGCMIAPVIGGQLVDRWMPTQLFLGIAHLLGAVFLYLCANQVKLGPMWVWMFVYSLCYAPTLALTNSICFHNLKNAERDFGRIRLWGTLGWIVAGLLVWGIRSVWHTDQWLDRSDLLLTAAALSAVMGLFCFALPHTPPKKSATNPLAFLEALSLLKDRNFLVFLLISFVVTTELQFYYMPTSDFLVDRGVPGTAVTAVMTVAQAAEIIVLFLLLHLSLKHLGVRKTMAIGVLAWPVRYLLFTVPSLPVIVGALTFHGFGFAFFFVASQIYVNFKAKDDMRASAQALLTFTTLGLGNFLGTYFTGWCWDFFSTFGKRLNPLTQVMERVRVSTNWSAFFLVPTAITVLCALAFLLLFRDDVKSPPETQRA
jgi:nucleoside transporter